MKNHRHFRDVWAKKFGPVNTEKFLLKKRSDLNVFLSLNMSLETFFRVESEIAFA